MSCGAPYHLRQAKKHLALAGELGVNFKRDTVFKEVIVPGQISDTTVSGNWWQGDSTNAFNFIPGVSTSPGTAELDWLAWPSDQDTIRITTTKWKTKTVIRRDTITHKVVVYQQVECPEKTITVPVEANTEIIPDDERGKFIWGALGFFLGIVLCAVLSMIIMRSGGRQNHVG